MTETYCEMCPNPPTHVSEDGVYVCDRHTAPGDKPMTEWTDNEGKWVVELEPGVWLATTEGDPGRTLKRENARLYNHPGGADIALQNARKYRPFENARVLPAEMEDTSQGIDMNKIERQITALEEERKTCGVHIGETGDTCNFQYLMDETAESMRLMLDVVRAAEKWWEYPSDLCDDSYDDVHAGVGKALTKLSEAIDD